MVPRLHLNTENRRRNASSPWTGHPFPGLPLKNGREWQECYFEFFGAGSPGAPMPANNSAADFVERTLSLFLRLRPAFAW